MIAKLGQMFSPARFSRKSEAKPEDGESDAGQALEETDAVAEEEKEDDEEEEQNNNTDDEDSEEDTHAEDKEQEEEQNMASSMAVDDEATGATEETSRYDNGEGQLPEDADESEEESGEADDVNMEERVGDLDASNLDVLLNGGLEEIPTDLQRVPCDDDMSDEDMSEAEHAASTTDGACSSAGQPASSAAPASATALSQSPLKPAPIPIQVAECKAKIAELQRLKQQRLDDEDFMGAHEAKQLILQQEEKLKALRQEQESIPTPARASSLVPASSPSRPSRGPRVSLAMGPSKRQSIAQPSLEAAAAAAEEARLQHTTSPSGSEASEEVASSSGSRDASVEEGGSEAASEEVGVWRTSLSNPDLMELQGEEGNINLVANLPFALPVGIFDRLYPYQRSGVAWMARLFQKRMGGVLADEMGLGKTIQVCALLNGARKAGATHALLVMPVSLLDQWAREAKLWCPGWPVYIYHGPAHQRAKALRGIRKPMGGLLITSYSLLSNCEDLLQVLVEDIPEPKRRRAGRQRTGEKPVKRRKLDDDDGFDEFEEEEEERCEPELPGGGELPPLGSSKPWDLVVCDEAHRMKNMSSLLAKSTRKLGVRCRILLTGTPVQNALQDLWALMDFAQPGLLGNHATFVKTFSDPIDRGSVRGAKVWAVELKKHLSEQLRALISPHLLRRTKLGAGLMEGEVEQEDVAMEDAEEDVEGVAKKLPPKKETIVWLYPSEEQRAAYLKVLEQSEIIKEAASKSKMGVEVFRAIGLLKSLCNHPLLLLPTPKRSDWTAIWKEVQESAKEVLLGETPEDAEDDEMTPSSEAPAADADQQEEEASCASVVDMLQKLPRNMEDALQQSAKLRCLAELLPELAARGHRTLIFTSSVKMIDLVYTCCIKPNGLRCLRIDGETDATARAEKVAKFNKQPNRFQCMLLSVAVGGVGLNLTSADRVVLVDPAWNPAIDAQAVDRAFRIGQTKEVRVYRLIMSGLIEDRMFRLQVFKMGLTRTALEADQGSRYFTAKEIRALFEWVDPAQGETRQLLLDKHGKDSEDAICAAAAEDGSLESVRAEGEPRPGWLKAGSVVGLSDFACLYGVSAKEEEEPQDEAFSAQVAEAKQKLGAADEKLQKMQQAREQAEAEKDRVQKELEEANGIVEQLKEKRQRVDEALSEKRSELKQARRGEAAVQAKLDKAHKSVATVKDKVQQQQEALDAAFEAVDTVGKTVVEAAQIARSAEDAFLQVLAEAEGQLRIVDDKGYAVGKGCVDAGALDRRRKAQKALERVKAAIENYKNAQAEVDAADEDIAKADVSNAGGIPEPEAAACGEEAERRTHAELLKRSRERERQRLEQEQEKAQQRSETSVKNVLSAVQVFTEAGLWFSESLVKTESRPVKADQVKAAVAAVKAAFKPLKKHWEAVKSAREAQGKASLQKRKVSGKVAQVQSAKADAELVVRSAERERENIKAEEAKFQSERIAKESELAEAEAARQAVDHEEADMKKKLKELKAVQPTARDAVKAARAAEKEADNERKALHATAEKREKEHEKLESAKNSAVRHLKSEQYDSRQVENAYEGRVAASKKGATE
eukprot:TRINITY_DN4937_c0_g1_i1.p1 TRINITY_DN4937_c0_g1~~TRINITY_DN4937_c0_g1_i1.p1  ORF type:complete len:1573 (+),score=524.53 TRINITY_DN4937_c0_g1_i1:64-4782(+)